MLHQQLGTARLVGFSACLSFCLMFLEGFTSTYCVRTNQQLSWFELSTLSRPTIKRGS
jgi:hypothetical protein